MANKEAQKKKSVYKPKAVSGFPEWRPEERLIEQQWFDHIRKVFESYGFCNIETPSVEELDVITAKGEVDKEIYAIERLQADPDEKKEARLALHFDLTVPLARYVAQHFNDLTFPFKRYQMQRVWRGERPQTGRFREFYQCDIDVINVDHLPLHFDAEMPAIIWEVLNGLPGMENEKIQLRISNRKILLGLLDAWNVENKIEVSRAIDKIEKIGKQDVFVDLTKLGLNLNQIELIMVLAATKGSPSEISGLLRDFIARNDVIARSESDDAIQALEEGIEELETVMKSLAHLPKGAVVADLSIVRGLDYYTGTVYETVFLDENGKADHTYGSICSGGRYDDLASGYINKSLPGVGISIGFSRLFSKLLNEGKLPLKSKSPAVVLMTIPSEEDRDKAMEAARTLRKRGYNVEMYHAPQKIKKQIAYAEKKGIPYVWFPDLSEVKSLQAGRQYKADPGKWHRRKIREG